MNYRTLDEMKIAAEMRFAEILKRYNEVMQGERMEYTQQEVLDAAQPQEPELVQSAPAGQLE